MNYIELFAGIGGFRSAVEHLSRDTGIELKCVGFSEIDRYALMTYGANYRLNGETAMHDIVRFAADPGNIAALPDRKSVV